MIRFQNVIEETRTLAEEIENQINLIRALANFNLERDVSPTTDDLCNQRTQLVNSIRDLEEKFKRLNELWKKALDDAEARQVFHPDGREQLDVVTDFIKRTVPAAMQPLWNQEFSGSLLVFFEKGKISSSSLLEKSLGTTPKAKPAFEEQATPDQNEKPVSVVTGSLDSFRVLRGDEQSKFNIYFSLAEPGHVIIKIHNRRDELVRHIEKYFDEPGDFAVEWNGRDNQNQKLPRDTYFCQIQTDQMLSGQQSISLD